MKIYPALNVPGLLLAVLCILSACGPSKKQKEEQLRSEVMAIHDEVMPRTEEMYRLRKRLQAMADSLLKQDLTDTLLRHEIERLILQLRKADDSMMSWMHNYNGGAGLYDHNELMRYLQEEKRKIEAVRQAIIEAIDSTNAFLERRR
jgi:hypothetical protein